MPDCYGVIPARWASSRFPGKPLALILGKPMFRHVWERARACPALRRVVLATDDERIISAAREWEVEAVMTNPDHASGTDRVLEAALKLGVPDDAVVVNIQGDEPALDPRMLTALTEPFEDQTVCVSTLARPISDEESLSPDLVKVVWTERGDALYFSRSPIPFSRDGEAGSRWGHIGLYAFRMEALRRFAALPPSPLERLEKLEQLRLLENGVPIRVVPTSLKCHGVDRPEDIEAAERLLTETLHASHSRP